MNGVNKMLCCRPDVAQKKARRVFAALPFSHPIQRFISSPEAERDVIRSFGLNVSSLNQAFCEPLFIVWDYIVVLPQCHEIIARGTGTLLLFYVALHHSF